MNYFNYSANSNYPTQGIYSPEKIYPEYPFANINTEKNDVYEMIREIFEAIGLDSDNVGSDSWNPLGEYVNSGNTVLIKPNLVYHRNKVEEDMQKGMECLITHPSIVRCVFDYVYIALKGEGKIIIADAPIQDCDFDKLQENTGYGELFTYLKGLETDTLKIEIGDMRDTRLEGTDTKHQRQRDREDKQWAGRVVNLENNSNFADVKKKSGLRITNYHGGDTVRHHSKGKNEYCISDAMLQADVIFNLVKPKSHRIAGYTAALKNMIGINTRKEYLPHHRKGSNKCGGDEYQHSHVFLKYIKSMGNDVKNWALKNQKYQCTDRANDFCRFIGRKLNKLEKDRKDYGMWYGNDTIWRTILDVNYIVRYCDKKGELQKAQQRKVVHLGDMIVCGDHEGPICPSYKYVGGILYSDNAVEFDACVVRLMGFDCQKFPTLMKASRDSRLYRGNFEDVYLCSNTKEFIGRVAEIDKNFSFVPTGGWKDIIGK